MSRHACARHASIACVIGLGVCQLATAAEADEWRQDVELIVRDLESVHPNAFTKIPHDKFLDAANRLESELSRCV